MDCIIYNSPKQTQKHPYVCACMHTHMQGEGRESKWGQLVNLGENVRCTILATFR